MSTLEQETAAILSGDSIPNHDPKTGEFAEIGKQFRRVLDTHRMADAILAHKVTTGDYRAFVKAMGVEKTPVHQWPGNVMQEFAQKFGLTPIWRSEELLPAPTKRERGKGGVTEKRAREIAHEVVDERVDSAVKALTSIMKEVQKVEHVIQVGTGPKVDLGDEPMHAKLPEVLAMLSLGLNVLLIGPAGSGKSFLARQAATILGARKFGHLSCTAGSSEGHLLGRLLPIGDGGRFEYVSTEWVDIYENGGQFLLDEVDALDANMALALNDGLANGRMSLPSRLANPIATKHPEFRLIAAANTYGTGADRLYVGRNQLDEAFLDRFRMAQIEMDYDVALEKRLCPNVELRQRFVAIRAAAQAANLRRVVSTRAMEQAHRLVANGGQSIEYAVEQLVKGWTKDERRKVGLAEVAPKTAAFKEVAR